MGLSFLMVSGFTTIIRANLEKEILHRVLPIENLKKTVNPSDFYHKEE